MLHISVHRGLKRYRLLLLLREARRWLKKIRRLLQELTRGTKKLLLERRLIRRGLLHRLLMHRRLLHRREISQRSIGLRNLHWLVNPRSEAGSASRRRSIRLRGA